MFRTLLAIVLLSSLSNALAQQKNLSKRQAGQLIAKQSWQYGTTYTVLLDRDVVSLPILSLDRSYLKKILEHNGWEYKAWGSGNCPEGPRRTDMTFQKDNMQCRLARIYKYAAKVNKGYHDMQLSEEITFTKD